MVAVLFPPFFRFRFVGTSEQRGGQSALDSTNVEDAFREIIRKVHRKMRVKKIVEENAKQKETISHKQNHPIHSCII